MKLALVSPLPPLASPAADLVTALVPHLRSMAEVRLMPHAPELTDGRFEGICPVDPVADLPHLLATGAVDVPVYFVADLELHGHQLRFVREHPGIVVLLTPGVHGIVAKMTEESGDLPAYRELLVEEHGAVARDWPERYVWRVDRDRIQARLPLAGLVCRRSHSVLAPSDVAARLRHHHPELPIHAIADPSDASAVATMLLTHAREALEQPRDIPQLPQSEWPAVEVVIVGYNCKAIITPALQSIAEQDYPNLRCTLVDNACTDGTGDFVRETFPAVRVLASDENLGFAGGNNFAFDRSDAKYLILFNQDAIARRDFVRELVRVAERDENIAAVGAKMLMLRCPTIFNSTGIVMNEGGFAVDRQIGEKDESPSPVPERVFGACGGAKLLRSSVLKKVGGFDDSFFMYCEDVDLCWRMRITGHEILYAPLAVVRHDWFGDLDDQDKPQETEEEMTAKTLRRRFLCERNRMQCVIKNFELKSMTRALRRLRKYDKIRLGYIKQGIARGGADVTYLRMVRKAIRDAWKWCGTHSVGLWRRRKQVQRMRTVSDEQMREFIDPGVHEPYHVGDLQVIHDRFSATGVPRLQMGVSDKGALGPGWYEVEHVPDHEWNLRWSKGRAWIYLKPERPARTLKLHLSCGPVPTTLQVLCGEQAFAPRRIENPEMHVIEFSLDATADADRVHEVRLVCDTFQPSQIHGNEDHRLLGLRLAEAWLE